MTRQTQWVGLALLLVVAGLVGPRVPRAAAQEAVVVGRIAHTEGQVLRFVPESLSEKYQAASRLSIKRVIATYTNVSLVIGNSS
jgi:hypothetical protein